MTQEEAFHWGRGHLGQWLLQGRLSGRAAAVRGRADLRVLQRLCREAGPDAVKGVGSSAAQEHAKTHAGQGVGSSAAQEHAKTHAGFSTRPEDDGRALVREQLWLLLREAEGAVEALRGARHLPGVPFEGRCPRVALLGERLAALAISAEEIGEDSPKTEKNPSFFPLLDAALEGVQDLSPLTEPELGLLRPALVLGVVHELRRRLEQPSSETSRAEVARLLQRLRALSARDWSAVTEGLSVLHRGLLRDPVYPDMDPASRAHYRWELARRARRSRRTESEELEELLERSGGEHVGALLFPAPQGGGGWYPAAVAAGTAALTGLLWAAAGPWWALAGLLPCSELARQGLDALLRTFGRPRPVFRLSLEDGVPPEGRTLCVLTALLSDEDEVRGLCQRLEDCFLTNRDAGEQVIYGLLADLPDAPTPPAAAERALVELARREIAALNRCWGGRFVLLCRAPVYVPSEERYRGRERKRGALMELLDLLQCAPSPVEISAGDPNWLKNVTFLLTLDSDTRLAPGAVRTMVGALLHPLNAPVVDPERRVVVRGHGLLQPRMTTTLNSANATPFAALFCGAAGSDPYGGGGLYHDRFDRESYCGKGLLHAESARRCLAGRFPENRILSHDLLEGAFLRAGACPQAEAADAFPASPQSYLRRQHRWVRGDWQAGRWCCPTVPDGAGRRVRTVLCALDRWKVFDNLRRSLLPPAAALVGLLWGFGAGGGSALTALVTLTALAAPLLLGLGALLLHPGRWRPQRCFARRWDGLGGAVLRLLVTLALLPAEAWTNASAVVTALWRLKVTHRGLLEWAVAGREGRRRWFWTPNVLLGTALLVLGSAPGRVLGAVWLLGAPVLEALGRKSASKSAKSPGAGGEYPQNDPKISQKDEAFLQRQAVLLWQRKSASKDAKSPGAGGEYPQNDPEISQKDEAYLQRQAALIWRWFDTWLRPEDHFLPPDNVQELPALGPARRTSPTNVGLALLACLAAVDLGLTDRARALFLIENQLKSVEKLEKFQGHLYNWYDTATLRPLPPRFVSTVDSGNLCAALLTLEAGLRELDAPELAHRAGALAAAMSFRCLWDAERRLFFIGWDAEQNRFTEGRYDLLASEARLTSYLTVARGDVPAEHWRRLGRTLCAQNRRFGLVSWSGTLFEYFMPHLLLDAPRGSLLWESLALCVWVQRRWGRRLGLPWGVSESGYCQLDAGQSYQYKAHGVPPLGLCPGLERERVVAPYASFLALDLAPEAAAANLRRLAALGAEGQYGFYEAVDFTPRRTGGRAVVVRSWMVHHQAMSLLAVDNALLGHPMRRRFHASGALRAFRPLLEERLPLGLKPPKTPLIRLERSKMSTITPYQRSGSGFDPAHAACHILAAGALSLPGFADGEAALWRDGLLLCLPESVSFTADGLRHTLLPRGSGGSELRWRWDGNRYELSLDAEGLRFQFTRQLEASGLLCGLSLEAHQTGTLRLRLSPVLDRPEVFQAHPAFSRLGLERKELPAGVAVTTRPPKRAPGLVVLWEGPAKLLSGEGAALELELAVTPGRQSLRWAVCPGEVRSAYRAAQGLLMGLSSGEPDRFSALGQQLGLDRAALAQADAAAGALLRGGASAGTPQGQRSLWAWGISGDLPLWAVTQTEAAPLALRLWALLRGCGLVSDLALLTAPEEQNALKKCCEELSLDRLLGGRGGVHLLERSTEATACLCPMAELVELPAAGADAYQCPPPAPERWGVNPAPRRWHWEGACFCWSGAPGRHWSQILTNARFGWTADECGTGHLWSGNAHQNKLTPWYNDPRAPHGPERLFVLEKGVKTALFSAEDGISTELCYGPGFARWEKRWKGRRTVVTAFVPVEGEERLFLVEAEGFNPDAELLWELELQMGPRPREARFVTLEEENGRILARNPTNPNGAAQILTLCASLPLTLERGAAPNRFSLRAGLPGALVLSAGTGLDPTVDVNKAKALLERCRDHWQRQAGALQIQTPDEALNHYLSFWGRYQVLACRLMARTALYQCGGAYGFRDQLQDAVGLLPEHPELARAQILRCCAHQYREGDVQHWWHPLPVTDWGVRTRISDDLLWLPWAAERYVRVTGDRTLLEESVPYLNTETLAPEERDRCEAAVPSEEAGSVQEHCLRALERVLARGTGEHGLLKMGTGDWNDGMDKVGDQGRGESVWLSWFAALVLRRFAGLCPKERRARYEDAATTLAEAAEQSWDGAWYLRAWDDAGRPLGGRSCPWCQLDSVAQSFAVFAPSPDRDHARQAVEAAASRLYDPVRGTVALLTPPFPPDAGAGYLCAYPEGVRENGAQYTHAAVWLALALYRLGDAERGWTLLRALLPERHPTEVYQGEPYVLAADVYTAPAEAGRAGWTWYTGSAAWFCRAATERLLGLRVRGNRLFLRPQLPADWPGYRAVWRLGEAELHIRVERAASAFFTVDGRDAEQGLPLSGLRGRVELVLGIAE